MNKLKRVSILALLLIGISSCDSISDCGYEDFCQRKNTKIANAFAELNDIGQKVTCGKTVTENDRRKIESVINKLETSQEIATLAAVARSVHNFESDSVPTCLNGKSDAAFDQAFWFCIEKLLAAADDDSKRHLEKLKKTSFLTPLEERHLKEISEK